MSHTRHSRFALDGAPGTGAGGADDGVGESSEDQLLRDLKSLQREAQGLNTHAGADDGVPPVKRDFAQLLQGSLLMVQSGLAAAARGSGADGDGGDDDDGLDASLGLGGVGGSAGFSLDTTDAAAAQQQISINATQLLAHTSYDNDKVRRNMQTLDLRSNFEPRENVGNDVESFLSHYHQIMVCTAIDEAKESTFVQCTATVEAQLAQDWAHSKQRLMSQLGLTVEPSNVDMAADSRLGVSKGAGSLFAPSPSHGVRTPARTRTGARTPGGLMLEAATPGPYSTPGASMMGGPGPSGGGMHNPSLTPGADDPMTGGAGMHSGPTRVYAEAVRRMAESRRPGGHVDYSVASAFKEAAVTLNQATPTASSQVIKPWDVIVSMMHEPVPGAAHGAWGGAGAVVSVGGTDELSLAAGAARYLEAASGDYVSSILSKARKQAGRGGELGLRHQVRAWINLKKTVADQRDHQAGGITAGSWSPWFSTSTPVVDGLPLWPQVFYCLRCGGRREAVELVREAVDHNALPKEVAAALNAVVTALESPGLGGDAGLGGSASPAAAAIRTLHKWFEQVDAKSGDGGSTQDPFQREVLNLLGHGEPAQQSVSPVVFPKLQDFVWQKLVFVLTSHLGEAAGVTTRFQLPDLARMVTMHGPQLFDPDHRQPYKYFQLLLLCGRFERAINYLAKHAGHGDLTPAVHFALALHHYGALRTRPGPAVVQAMRAQQAPGGGGGVVMGEGIGAGAGAGAGAGGRLPAMSPSLGIAASSSSLLAAGGHGDGTSSLTLPGASSNATLDAFLWLDTAGVSQEDQAEMELRAGLTDTSGAGSGAASGADLLADEYLDLAGLVLTYVRTKLQGNPCAAADYLCMLLDRENSKNRAVVRALLTELVLSSDRATDDLLGRLSDQLRPQQGHLEQRVTAELVRNVVRRAAKTAWEQGKLWRAAMLYLRLGPSRVADVLRIVNQRLSALAPVASLHSSEGDARRKWVALAQAIQTYVVPRFRETSSLSAGGSRGTPRRGGQLGGLGPGAGGAVGLGRQEAAESGVETLARLLHIVEFYDCVNAHSEPREVDALAALARTGLLPLPQPMGSGHSDWAAGQQYGARRGGQQYGTQAATVPFDALAPVLQRMMQHIIFTALRCLVIIIRKQPRDAASGAHNSDALEWRRQAMAVVEYHSHMRRYIHGSNKNDLDQGINELVRVLQDQR